MKFTIRIDDMEVRSCGPHLLLDCEHMTADIIKWEEDQNGKSCYSLAYWIKTKEGYDLQFVGNRPFETKINAKIFFDLAKIGQQILESYFWFTDEP